MSKEIEMKKQVTEPLLDPNSKFKNTARELADICILDNHYKESARSDVVISSRMIVEKFGGYASICAGLFTDARSGLNETVKETEERKKVYGVNAFAPP